MDSPAVIFSNIDIFYVSFCYFTIDITVEIAVEINSTVIPTVSYCCCTVDITVKITVTLYFTVNLIVQHSF